MAVKKPEQTPQSYSPKKPAIVKMAKDLLDNQNNEGVEIMSMTIKPTAFEYMKLPALRFIGIDSWRTKEGWEDMWLRKDEILEPLNKLSGYILPEIPYVGVFCHHDDGEVDIVNRYLVGRFFKADSPIPDGYDHHDLSPQTVAYAVFENGVYDKFFQRYEITRDTILADGVSIPYPVGYWHGEVYYDKTPVINPSFNCGVLFATNKDKTT